MSSDESDREYNDPDNRLFGISDIHSNNVDEDEVLDYAYDNFNYAYDNFNYSYNNYFGSSLYKAVFNGNFKRVLSLLDEYPGRNFDEPMLLHTAAAKGYDQIVDLLCQRNFSVNKVDKFGEIPLHIAIKENQASVFNLLLDKSNLNATNFRNETPLHFALRGHHTQLAEKLLQCGVDINTQDSGGTAPLHLAVDLNQISLVENILQNGADVNVQNKVGKTSLHLATSCQNVHLVEILLKKGAKIEAGDDTSLHVAAGLKDVQLLKMFLSYGVNINIQNTYGETPLHRAVELNCIQSIEILLQHGANVNLKNKSGRTPLHLAANNKDVNLIKILLESGADVNEKDNNYETPLHTAIKLNYIQHVELFLQNGANINAQDAKGAAPLHLAANLNPLVDSLVDFQIPLVEIIFQNGANVDVKNKKGETPLHLATLCKNVHLVEILLKKGADVNMRNNKYETPLHIAADSMYISYVVNLAKSRIKFNMRDKDSTSIDLEAKNKSVCLVEILLENNATVNVRDKDNMTPLHIAARLNHIELVEILLKNGAKVDDQENENINITPLYYAAKCNNKEMIEMLMMSEYYTAEIKNNACKAVLNLAVDQGNLTLVEYLIETGFEVPNMSETEDQQLNQPKISDKLAGVLKSCFAPDRLLDTSFSNRNLKMWSYLLKNCSKINSNEYSQLHVAVQAGQVKTVRRIIKETNKIESDSLASKLAVYIAVESENEEILKILLKAGYSTDSCYEDRTPLHIAATFNHTRLVKSLLEAGADINSKTKNNYTPLDFAAAAGQSAVVKFLLDAGAEIKSLFFSLKNVLKRDSYRANHWLVTPCMFKNLLNITEMFLIADVGDIDYSSRDYEKILKYTMMIRVARKNEENDSVNFNFEEVSNEECEAKKSNNSGGEFRPEILSCLLVYLKNELIKDKLYPKMVRYLHIHPSVLDNILVRSDKVRISLYGVGYSARLLVVGHIEDVDILTNIPPDMSIYNKVFGGDILKLIVARLVFLPDNLDSKKKKLKFYKEHKLENWQRECEEQKKNMVKTEIIDECNVTFYDILKQPVEKIVNYIRNNNLLEILESSYMKFPAYTGFLQTSVEKGKRRKDLIDKCVNYMLQLIKINYKIHFSSIDIHSIFRYLSVNDLFCLSVAFI